MRAEDAPVRDDEWEPHPVVQLGALAGGVTFLVALGAGIAALIVGAA